MFAIIGLGATGLSVVRYCQRKNIPCWVCDTRMQPKALAEFQEAFPNIPFYLGELPQEKLADAHTIVISPGISRDHFALALAKQKNIPIIGDIELFVREAKAPIVAITGTNAKGTVTTMLGSILQASDLHVLLGGNIGTPALDLLTLPIPNYYVLELSSFQLESTFSLKAEVATILNVTPDHLDYHHTFENYMAAKQRIYQHAKHILYNATDLATYPQERTHAMSFSLNPPNHEHVLGMVENDLMWGQKNITNAFDLKVKGKHNWENALAAAGLAIALNISLENIRRGLLAYGGLPHRCEWVRRLHEVDWFNDSKGTNVGATMAAIKGLGPSLSGKLILIGGGQAKEQDFTPLQKLCEQFVRILIVFGQDALLLKKTLEQVCEVRMVKNLEEAVNLAESLSQVGDAVLLSPACASLDMFKNFEERGEQFKKCVWHLHSITR